MQSQQGSGQESEERDEGEGNHARREHDCDQRYGATGPSPRLPRTQVKQKTRSC